MKCNLLRGLCLFFISATTIVSVGCSQQKLSTPRVEEFSICINSSEQRAPSISGDIVVWLDRRNNNSNVVDIYGYNLSSKHEFPIYISNYNKTNLAVSSGHVSWLEACGYPTGIASYDMASGIAQVAEGYPSEDWLWNTVFINDTVITEQNGEIHCSGSNAKDLSICNQSNEPTCHVSSGNILIWQDRRNSNWDIFGYNSSTGTEFAVCTLPSNQSQPAIAGPIVVWADERNGNSDIYGYNLSTGIEFPICTSTGNQTSPAISENTVVWVDDRNGNTDIYGARLTFDNQ